MQQEQLKENITIQEWILNTQTLEDIRSINQVGCINGACNELIYYDDTTKFYDCYKYEIWDFLEMEAENQGFKNVLEFMSTWGDYAENVCSDRTFKNLLAWWAVEHVCYQILEDLDLD